MKGRIWLALLACAAISYCVSPALAQSAPSDVVHSTTDAASVIELRVQPVHEKEVTLPLADIETLLGDVGAWLNRTSGGAWGVRVYESEKVIEVADSSCRALAHAVAHARQLPVQAPGQVTLYVGAAVDCPYRGLAETPGSWVLVSQPPSSGSDLAWSRTVAHELGHIIGVRHAGAWTCPVMSHSLIDRGSSACEVDEYGDLTDPMGRGALSWNLGPFTCGEAGWCPSVRELDTASRTYDAVLSLGGSIVAVDPRTGVRYAVSFRAPASGRVGSSRGIYLYRAATSGEYGVTSVLLPWSRYLVRPVAGKTGAAFLSPSRGFALEVLQVRGDAASIRVHIDASGRLEDKWPPVFLESYPRMVGNSRLVLPRASDQSGVRRYLIKSSGRVLSSITPRDGISSWTVDLPPSWDRSSKVRVLAVDGNGNVTVTRLQAQAELH